MPTVGTFSVSACGQCGAPLGAGARFCAQCGRPIEVTFAGVASLYNAAPAHAVAPEVDVRPAAWFVPATSILVAAKVSLWVMLFIVSASALWILLGLFLTFGLALAIAMDAQQGGLVVLPLSRVNLSATERTSGVTWAMGAFFGWMVVVPWYLAVRSRLWRRAAQTKVVGMFPDRRARRRAVRMGRALAPDAVLPAA